MFYFFGSGNAYDLRFEKLSITATENFSKIEKWKNYNNFQEIIKLILNKRDPDYLF
jgi:hypothetical protein